LIIYIKRVEPYTSSKGAERVRFEAMSENYDKRMFNTTKEELATAGFNDAMISDKKLIPIEANIDLWSEFAKILKLEVA
jgi:hypothetical protein